LSHNLAPNAAYHELKEFGKEVHAIENHLLNLKKDCKAAIVVDNASLTALDEFPINEEKEKSIGYNHILRQFYDACYQMNLECDLVSTADDFSAYPILIAPALYSVSEATLKKIRDYVKNGGHLLLSFRSAFADEELKIYHDNQPHLLTDCIGATYDQFTYPENVTLRFTEESCLPADASFPVLNWMELVTPTTAKVWAYYEHPFWSDYAAITHQEYGMGSATYLACFTSIATLQQMIRRLCNLAGITLPEYRFPLIRKQGTNDNGKYVRYYFNYSSSPVFLNYDGKKAKNLLTGEHISTHDKQKIDAWDLLITEED
jgi:beta-galactosidase